MRCAVIDGADLGGLVSAYLTNNQPTLLKSYLQEACEVVVITVSSEAVVEVIEAASEVRLQAQAATSPCPVVLLPCWLFITVIPS